MVRAAFMAVTALTLAFQAHAAEPQRRVTHIANETGTCSKLLVSGHDFTAACQSRVSNIDYSDGYVSFSYSAGRDFVLTFAGNGRRQVHDGPDTAIQPIDTMSSSIAGQSSKPSRVVGSCRFSNPYKGPAIINCGVDIEGGGRAQAEFESDGNLPIFLPVDH